MPITPVPSQVRRVHVYEIINRTRLESLLVVTGLDEADLLPRLRRDPPSEVRHWEAGDDVGVEALGQHMTPGSAEEFLRGYLDHMAGRTWRFRLWRV